MTETREKTTSENVNTRKPFAFHAILWSFSLILAFYVNNFGQHEISNRMVFALVALLAVFSTGLVGLFSLWKRKGRALCLLLSLFWILFFSVGPLIEYLMANGIMRYRFIALIFCLILGVSGFFLLRSKRPMILPTRVMNRIALAFIIILGVQFLISLFSQARRSVSTKTPPVSLKIAKTAKKPDIYYLLVDGYPGDRILKKYYDFDNSPFTDFLKDKGFWVPEGIANYTGTKLVLSSVFKMNYHQEELPENPTQKQVKQVVEVGPRKFAMIEVLNQAGYDVITNGSQFIPSGVYRSDNVRVSKITGLSGASIQTLACLIDNSLILPLSTFIVDQFASHDEPEMFKNLAASLETTRSKPQFYFSHIVLPHPPIRFRADGSRLKPTTYLMADFMKWDHLGYIGQVEYLNSELKRFIEKATNLPPDRRPVIIIHSDHGTATKGLHPWQWSNPSKELIDERTSILCTALFPGIDKKRLPKQMSPVNIFRLFIREYLDPSFQLLEEKSYFAPMGSYGFWLIDRKKGVVLK